MQLKTDITAHTVEETRAIYDGASPHYVPRKSLFSATLAMPMIVLSKVKSCALKTLKAEIILLTTAQPPRLPTLS